MLSRRDLVRGALALATEAPDRPRLVRRHNPVLRYHANGHNYQCKGLSLYLPGNGGLLA